MEVCGKRKKTTADTAGGLEKKEKEKMMELKILSPQDGGFIKEIKWNNEELKKEIAAKVQDYKTIAYTDVKDMKEDRATLNKLLKAIEDERKRVKKLCMAPVEKFELQVKEITALVQEPIQLISSQINEIEEQKRIEKKGKILEFFEENIGTLKGILSFEKVFKTEYLNAGKSMKSITTEIQELIRRVNTDLDTIEGFGSKYELQIKDVYLKTMDLSVAMKEKSRLEEIERQLEERRERERKAQEARRAEEEKSAAEYANVQSQEPMVLPQETNGQAKEAQQKEVREQKPELLQMDFRVWCTKEQLIKLRNYMIEKQIRFGKVE